MGVDHSRDDEEAPSEKESEAGQACGTCGGGGARPRRRSLACVEVEGQEFDFRSPR